MIDTGFWDRIYDEADAFMDEHYFGPDRSGACLYWAEAARKVLARNDVEAVLQAGSAAWLARPSNEDPCMWAYEWTPMLPEEFYFRCVMGKPPEMHAWVGIPKWNVIFDATYQFQPAKAKECIGMEWYPKLLPRQKYVAGGREMLENKFRCGYRPHSSAIKCAIVGLNECGVEAFRHPDLASLLPQD